MDTSNNVSVEEPQGNVVEQLGDKLLEKVLKHANARMVYGDPVQQGDRTIIPVARVSARFGFGGGSGTGKRAGEGSSSGTGGGGGGDIKAVPIGYIEMTPQGTEFRPIEDETQIAMAGIRIGLVFVIGLIIIGWRLSGRRKKPSLAEQVEKRRQRLAEAVPVPSFAGVAEPVARVAPLIARRAKAARRKVRAA
jgi:uncharacterized spore protein YtfJ